MLVLGAALRVGSPDGVLVGEALGAGLFVGVELGCVLVVGAGLSVGVSEGATVVVGLAEVVGVNVMPLPGPPPLLFPFPIPPIGPIFPTPISGFPGFPPSSFSFPSSSESMEKMK